MKLNVAVLYGGRSGEHEVSIRSAESIIAALDPGKFAVRKIFIRKDGTWDPQPLSPEPGKNPGIDVVFPVLHGTFGEDGTMQGLLELADLPYVGSGVLASSAAMDKDAAKRLFVQAGIPVADYVTLRKAADCRDLPFPYPVFVKPANLGSSVGISKARNFEELKTALDLAFRYDRKVLVERTIVGKEIECSVLGNRDPEASQPCQILPSQEFYDYDDKYLLDKTEFRIPADLSAAQIERVRRLAIRAYQTLECEGMARVDFLTEDATGEIYLNEVNTIPGFTSISMYPKMWDYSGLPYPKLLERLIELALERYGQKKNLKYER